MIEIVQIGNICADASAWANPSVGRVYDQRGLAPTINSGGGVDTANHTLLRR